MNLNRLGKYLSDYRRFSVTPHTSVDVVLQVEQLLRFVGAFSKTRKNLIDLGRSLLRNKKPRIFVPLCLISGTDSVFAMIDSHLGFIKQFPFSEFEVVFLLPKQVDDVLSQRVQDFLKENGYGVYSLYLFFQNLNSLEEFHHRRLKSSDYHRHRLALDVEVRRSLYEKMRICSYKERFDRALKTASEHLAFAQCIREIDGIVVMHTTTNLRHYKDMRVPVLHNEVALL